MYRQHNITSSVVENETHFLLDCDLYTDIRHSLYEKAWFKHIYSQFQIDMQTYIHTIANCRIRTKALSL